MMFRLFLLIFAVALSFTPPVVKAGPFDGFHAGSYSVINSGTVERQDFIGEVDGVALGGVEDTRALERGVTAGLSLGYGRVLQNKWFVSGEGFFNIGGAGEVNSTERAYHDYTIDLTGNDDDARVVVGDGQSRSLRIRDKHSFGFLARGGYRVAPGSIFYGIIGYSVSSVESRLTPYSGSQSAVFVKSSDNQGFLLGAGSEINLSETLSARMDFVHDQREGIDIVVGNYPEFSEQEISGQALKVGLTWRFGQHTFRGSTEDTDAEVTLSPGRLLGYKGMGLYAGLQGAYGYVPYNERSVIGGNTHRSDTGGLNGTGVGLFFGIGTDMAPVLGRKYSDWYIGVEGNGTYDFLLENDDEREIDGIGGSCAEGADNQIRAGTGLSCFDRVTVDTSIEYSFAATTRLGYMPNEHSMIYLRFGYGWAYYEVKRGAGSASNAFGYEPNPAAAAAAISGCAYRPVAATSDSWLTQGFTFGLGFESLLTRNVFMRLDWSYLDGDTVDLPNYAAGCGATGNENANLRAARSLNPDINKIAIGVGYVF